MVDVDAHQLFADGLDEQSRHHAGIHAAGQGQQNLLIAHLGANLGDLLVDELLGQRGGGDALHAFGTYIV